MTAAAPAVPRRELAASATDWRGLVFHGILLIALLFSLLILFVLVADLMNRGLAVLLDRGVGFLTSPSSANPAKAGVSQAIFGTLMMAVFVALIAFPVGIMTAVYLEEYAPD